MISWCQKEAKRRNLRPEEYWGGLIMDEMKIQVHKFVTIYNIGLIIITIEKIPLLEQ